MTEQKCCFISNGITIAADGKRVPCSGYTGFLYNDFGKIDPELEPGCYERCIQWEQKGQMSPRKVMKRDHASKYGDGIWYMDNYKLDRTIKVSQDFRYIQLHGDDPFDNVVHNQLQNELVNPSKVIVSFVFKDKLLIPTPSMQTQLMRWERIKIVYNINNYPTPEQQHAMEWWNDFIVHRAIRTESRTAIDRHNIWILPRMFDVISKLTSNSGFKSFVVRDDWNHTPEQKAILTEKIGAIVDVPLNTWIATKSAWNDRLKQNILERI